MGQPNDESSLFMNVIDSLMDRNRCRQAYRLYRSERFEKIYVYTSSIYHEIKALNVIYRLNSNPPRSVYMAMAVRKIR
jgi:hypothetical protein